MGGISGALEVLISWLGLIICSTADVPICFSYQQQSAVIRMWKGNSLYMYVTKIQLKLDNKVFPFTGLAPERNAAVCVDSFQDPLRTRYGSLEIKNKNETCHIMDPCFDINTTRNWAVVDFFICLFVLQERLWTLILVVSIAPCTVPYCRFMWVSDVMKVQLSLR